MQADEFIARVHRGDAGTAEIDGVTVVGPRRRRPDEPFIGCAYHDHPDHLEPGTFYVRNFDRNAYAWRVMEVVAPGRSTAWADTIGNIEPAECLRRAVRMRRGSTMLADSDLPLFAWAETPERFRRAKGDPRDYRAEWDAFAAERPDVAAYICEQVERRRDAGVARIAVNVIVEHAREAFAVTINNSWRAAIADDLCERDPRLDALIERRRRKVTK